jgi:hypothetical protein
LDIAGGRFCGDRTRRPNVSCVSGVFYGKAAIDMKEKGFRVVVTICAVMLAVLAFAPVSAEAKTKKQPKHKVRP